jgi:hypothetical protein
MEIDMRFTREHGIVRARIDCANPKTIPRGLEYFYYGEGFVVYFDIEAPDGSVVPARKVEIGDREEDDKGNKSNEGASKPEEDSSIPPSDGDATAGTKNEFMQQEGMDKPTEVNDTMQIGRFSFTFNNPMSTSTDDQSVGSAPSK